MPMEKVHRPRLSGATRVAVVCAHELCELVEEAIETLEEAGKLLPQPLSLQELENVLRRSA